MSWGPGNGLYAVTIGVYAAVGEYSTNFTWSSQTVLLAVAPILIFFFIIMQRHIVSGSARHNEG